MKKLLLILGMLFIATGLFSQERQGENYYQEEFAKAIDGITEVILPDRTRVDIMTDTFAIEVDFAQKWAESGFQALHYARHTNRKAGILLIWESQEDERYLKRLLGVIHENNLSITVWVWNWTNDTWSKVEYFFECEMKLKY